MDLTVQKNLSHTYNLSYEYNFMKKEFNSNSFQNDRKLILPWKSKTFSITLMKIFAKSPTNI